MRHENSKSVKNKEEPTSYVLRILMLGHTDTEPTM